MPGDSDYDAGHVSPQTHAKKKRSKRPEPPTPLADRLAATLKAAQPTSKFTQSSLAVAMGGVDQTTAGRLLKKGKATLDNADAALRHIGSSLKDFVNGVPPREMTDVEKLARKVTAREDWQRLLTAVERLTPWEIDGAIEILRRFGSLGPPPAESADERTPGKKRARRTTRRAKPRR